MPQRLRSGTQRRVGLAACLAGVVVGALTSAPSVHADGGHPVSAVCPASLTGTATCYTGQDSNGAYYAIAIPKTWNGSFVVHAHGGPDLGDGSDPERSVGDLDRWAVMVKEGYAWAGSSYRRGGYGTRMAAEDTENVRRLFIKEFGTPKRTYVHGQSWGGDVAAKVVETYSSKHGPYDGALLTSGVLAGGFARLRLPRRPARGLPVLLPQPSSPDRAAVPAVGGAARRIDDDNHRPARPPSACSCEEPQGFSPGRNRILVVAARSAAVSLLGVRPRSGRVPSAEPGMLPYGAEFTGSGEQR
jgi:hypothetical protein